MFNQPLDKWNLASMKDMSSMFKGGGFNQSLSEWDVSNVEDMTSMFENNKSFNQNIKGWDVAKVKETGNHDKFAENGALECKNNPFCVDRAPYLFEVEHGSTKTQYTVGWFSNKADAEAKTGTYFNVYNDKCIAGDLLTGVEKNSLIKSLKITDGSIANSLNGDVLTISCQNIYINEVLDFFEKIEVATSSTNKVQFSKPNSNVVISDGKGVHFVNGISRDETEKSEDAPETRVISLSEEVDFSQYEPALGVSVASANCNIENGKPNGGCTSASGRSNSGMFVGSSETGLTNVDITDKGRWNFQWSNPSNEKNNLRPRTGGGYEIKNLNFAFGTGSDVTGSNTEPYTITIGTDTNKVFLLNAGSANTLVSNLSVDFASSQDFTYYLNAKKLNGNLTLSGGGNFTAHLTDRITGAISNTGTNATFNFNGTQNITIDGAITANTGGTNHFNIIGSNSGTEVNVDGGISATETNGRKSENNFTLNATNGATNLTLNGANNTIDTFTALGGNTTNHNSLDFGVNTTGTKEIKELILGNDEIAGLLTITNAIGSIPTIGTFESKYTDSKLTLNTRTKVNIENIKGGNNNIEMGNDATLTLNGGFLNSLTSTNGIDKYDVIFAKGETTIAKGLSAVDGVKRNFTLKGSAGEGTKAIINCEIALGIPATIPQNNFTLDSTTGKAHLILKGKSEITSITSTGNDSLVTIYSDVIIEKVIGNVKVEVA